MTGSQQTLYLYALPAFILAMPTIPLFILLPTYYGEELGLGLAAVGLTFFALRILDVVSDPILGWISDRVQSSFGRRKLPMLVGGVIAAPALIALFNPPSNVSILYLFGCGAVLYVGWTAIQIPYLAWAAEITSDYHTRSKLNGSREAAGLLGILAIGFFGVLFTDIPQSIQYFWLATLTVCLGTISFIITFKFVPDKTSEKQNKQKFTFPHQNGLFKRLLTAWFINGLANGLPAVCLPLFMTHILSAGDVEKAWFLFLYFLAAAGGIPLWVSLAGKLGKHQVWCLSMCVAVLIFSAVPFLGEGDFILFGAICILTGVTLGSDLTLPQAIQADCADWDRYRFGQDRIASLYAYWSMATKLALGFAVGIAFPTLSFFELEQGGPYALDMLVFLYAGLPILLKLAAVGIMWSFPLNQKKHQFIQILLDRCS